MSSRRAGQHDAVGPVQLPGRDSGGEGAQSGFDRAEGSAGHALRVDADPRFGVSRAGARRVGLIVPECFVPDRWSGFAAGPCTSVGAIVLQLTVFRALICVKKPYEETQVVQLPAPGDPILDGSTAWAEDRPVLEIGTLTLHALASQVPQQPLFFTPLNLVSGIASSEDPLLAARTQAYRISLKRRAKSAVAGD